MKVKIFRIKCNPYYSIIIKDKMHDAFFSRILPTKIDFLSTTVSTVFFSMKMREQKKIVLVRCIIDFDDVQV